METHQYQIPRYLDPQLNKMTTPPSEPPHNDTDNERSTGELRALDCNLALLCDHIHNEGFNSGTFSDIVVHAMGSTYHLHRLILSRSPYFRNMLHGPWKEASSPVVNLIVDDKNVDDEAIGMALAYLYGHLPKLNDKTAFRVLAAASFLDLQDLCAICTNFIISELWTANFLTYQVFAESQDYGIHGERVRNACWGYLCQSGAMELKEVLPKLSSQTLHDLLTSDELWVPSEEKRFELALSTFLAKVALSKTEQSGQEVTNSDEATCVYFGSSKAEGKELMHICSERSLETEVENLSLEDDIKSCNAGQNGMGEPSECRVNFQTEVSNSNPQVQQIGFSQSGIPTDITPFPSTSSNISPRGESRTSCSFAQIPIGIGSDGASGMAMEGPIEEGSSYHVNNDIWITSEQPRHCSSMDSCGGFLLNDWAKCSISPLSWGGRVVDKKQVMGCAEGNNRLHEDEYDAFVNIFEGGSLLYNNMSFEALLYVRKQLEESGFPCKALNDGLWLQTLLSRRVQEIGAATCKRCWVASFLCRCRHPYGFDSNQEISPIMGNAYISESAQGEGNRHLRPVRVHVMGAIDGLAGIGRGTTFVPSGAWPPTRYVYSRVPVGTGSRNGPQSLANDDPEVRDQNGDISGDGLTALVSRSQGANNSVNVHGQQTERGYEDLRNRFSGTSIVSSAMQLLESPENANSMEWESPNNQSISLDLTTPLNHFPPFRFGVEFEDVLRLTNGQVKHSPEFFYAGSLWKVSVQAFNDEDSQGRRTLGLFLHRRKADYETGKKIHMYVDYREKVTARYQLICPSKREVLVFGNYKQRGMLLPKAPKGWGWRTALLFEELADLLQDGALRVAAVVQLV